MRVYFLMKKKTHTYSSTAMDTWATRYGSDAWKCCRDKLRGRRLSTTWNHMAQRRYISVHIFNQYNILCIFHFHLHHVCMCFSLSLSITYLCAEGKSSKEFKSIQLRNNSLTVDYVTDADEGFYMCTANNGIGPGLKKILHINVNGE